MKNKEDMMIGGGMVGCGCLAVVINLAIAISTMVCIIILIGVGLETFTELDFGLVIWLQGLWDSIRGGGA